MNPKTISPGVMRAAIKAALIERQRELGRRKSEKKTLAARENGKLGGRPKKVLAVSPA